jgi:hypothetical protein
VTPAGSTPGAMTASWTETIPRSSAPQAAAASSFAAGKPEARDREVRPGRAATEVCPGPSRCGARPCRAPARSSRAGESPDAPRVAAA